MPPTVNDMSLKFINDTNPQPMGDFTNITVRYPASQSPGVDHYNGYMFPSLQSIANESNGVLPLKYASNGRKVASTTNLQFTVSITNTTMGFPGVSSVNTNGVESSIRL